MFMRSMPSLYSDNRGNGITTSSLILKALVCAAIAAVRERSDQNCFRASLLTAIKPSASRVLAIRTTSEAAEATICSSSPAISISKTIFGKSLRGAFVV